MKDGPTSCSGTGPGCSSLEQLVVVGWWMKKEESAGC